MAKTETGMAKLLSNVKRNSPDLSQLGYRDLRAKIKAARVAKSAPGGPRARGGKRTPTDVSERAIFKAEIGRQVATQKPAPAAKKPDKASAPAVKAKATPTMTRGSMKRPEGTVKVADVQNKIEAPASSGIAKAKRNISVGGLVGRTGGKWHLGKKAGKG